MLQIARLSGNFRWKIPQELQSRSFQIPWLRKCAYSRSKCRTFCSSLPVRYKPNNSSKIKESDHSRDVKEPQNIESEDSLNAKTSIIEVSHGVSNIKKSTALKESFQKKQMPTKSFILDDRKPELKKQNNHDFGMSNSWFAEEPEEVFKEPNIYERKDYHELTTSQMGITKEDAENLAIRLLATRAYTAVELGKKLQGKRIPHDIIEAVISDFLTRGLINDSLFAETFSRSKWSSSSWGPRRIKQALVKKGVSADESEKALKLVFQDNQYNDDEEVRVGMSKLSMDQLFVQASKQWLRGQNVPIEKQKSRMIRWLQYRGFNWGVISFILKRLESQYLP